MLDEPVSAHDLAVVATMSDQVGVLYLGEFMELGTRDDVVGRTRHPYTRALIASSESRVESAPAALADIPSPIDLPGDCRFQSRCPHATARCAAERPVLRPVGAAHWTPWRPGRRRHTCRRRCARTSASSSAC